MPKKHSRREYNRHRKTKREIAYEKYMNSVDWAKKRRERLAIDKEACQFPLEEGGVCGCKENLEVHHKTYKRMGNEEMSDLVTLCKHHHEITHQRLNLQRSI